VSLSEEALSKLRAVKGRIYQQKMDEDVLICEIKGRLQHLGRFSDEYLKASQKLAVIRRIQETPEREALLTAFLKDLKQDTIDREARLAQEAIERESLLAQKAIEREKYFAQKRAEAVTRAKEAAIRHEARLAEIETELKSAPPDGDATFFLEMLRIRWFWHFTDTRNLASIQRFGALFSMFDLKDRWIKIEAPGGNQQSHDLDCTSGMDKYVHLCFTNKHPMEWVAREQDKRIIDTKWLKIDPSVLFIKGVLISPGVSNAIGINPLGLEEALYELDLHLLYDYIHNKYIEDKEQWLAVRKYELLVPTMIPSTLILNL